MIRCWMCLEEIPKTRSFSLDYLFDLPEQFYYRIDSYGFCKGCQPPSTNFYFTESPEVENAEFEAISVNGVGDRITIFWPLISRRRKSQSAFQAIRKEKFSANPNCACGKPASDLGHIIPRYWVQLNGYESNAADFHENLYPKCRYCNQEWLRSNSEMGRNRPRNPRAFKTFSDLLDRAIEVARNDHSLRILKVPPIYSNYPCGQPVLSRPSDSNKDTFDTIGYVQRVWRQRTHRQQQIPAPLLRGSERAGANPYTVLVSNQTHSMDTH